MATVTSAPSDMESRHADDFVGPIVTRGEMSDAVAEAVEIDNPGREMRVLPSDSYVRIEARGICKITFATMTDVLGRQFSFGDLEVNMPGFGGFIRTEDDHVRFVASKKD